MEVFFISIVSVIIINVCSGIPYYSASDYSSSTSSRISAIIIPIIVGIFIFIFIFIICKVKCAQRHRMGVLPLATQIALAQQENQYAPPPYHQPPPYGQPPPYEQPPPYSAPSAPIEPTRAMVTS